MSKKRGGSSDDLASQAQTLTKTPAHMAHTYVTHGEAHGLTRLSVTRRKPALHHTGHSADDVCISSGQLWVSNNSD